MLTNNKHLGIVFTYIWRVKQNNLLFAFFLSLRLLLVKSHQEFCPKTQELLKAMYVPFDLRRGEICCCLYICFLCARLSDNQQVLSQTRADFYYFDSVARNFLPIALQCDVYVNRLAECQCMHLVYCTREYRQFFTVLHTYMILFLWCSHDVYMSRREAFVCARAKGLLLGAGMLCLIHYFDNFCFQDVNVHIFHVFVCGIHRACCR